MPDSKKFRRKNLPMLSHSVAPSAVGTAVEVAKAIKERSSPYYVHFPYPDMCRFFLYKDDELCRDATIDLFRDWGKNTMWERYSRPSYIKSELERIQDIAYNEIDREYRTHFLILVAEAIRGLVPLIPEDQPFVYDVRVNQEKGIYLKSRKHMDDWDAFQTHKRCREFLVRLINTKNGKISLLHHDKVLEAQQRTSRMEQDYE